MDFVNLNPIILKFQRSILVNAGVLSVDDIPGSIEDYTKLVNAIHGLIINDFVQYIKVINQNSTIYNTGRIDTICPNKDIMYSSTVSHVTVVGATPFQAVLHCFQPKVNFGLVTELGFTGLEGDFGCYSPQSGKLITAKDFKINFNLISTPYPEGGYVVYAGLSIPQPYEIVTHEPRGYTFVDFHPFTINPNDGYYFFNLQPQAKISEIV